MPDEESHALHVEADPSCCDWSCVRRRSRSGRRRVQPTRVGLTRPRSSGVGGRLRRASRTRISAKSGSPSWIRIEPCAWPRSQPSGRFWGISGWGPSPVNKTRLMRRGGGAFGRDKPAPPEIAQRSTCSAMERASSTSMPRYLTVLSILVWPSNSCTARRLPVRR
jgi:hypothetical protein